MSSETCIDSKVFSELKEATGEGFLAELIDTYCEETPRLLAQLQTALADENAEAFRRLAHSIKSSSATFGAIGLATQARALEMIGREGDLSRVGILAERLASDYAEVKRTLRGLQHAA